MGTLGQKIPINEIDLINSYRDILKEEMIRLGADEEELKLIKDATIRNAIKRNRKPEDVAWAILQ